jgi:uncharacterized protein YyaL (SSP411 family)
MILSLTAFALLVGALRAEEPPKGHTNRLAKESSPYLRQHAHNPVDWYPWGPEAFEKAKKEGKLVFLSIGYSSCHWCHVMERESFSNTEVAKMLNESFVCIKVDREERPDIDEIYMTALQAFGQSGGWPLSMFLLPDGKPIIGGTYWPPDDRELQGEKVKGFKSILKLILQIQKDDPKKVTDQAAKLSEITNERLSRRVPGAALVKLDRAIVDDCIEQLLEEFDETYGGFGRKARGFRGPKFPTPCYLQLLQHEAGRNKALPEKLALTLDRMARGGIFDHIGGGFHRYSTERTWTIPHFEKMLYDNAQLAEVYAAAYRTGARPEDARTLRHLLDFVLRELTSPEGGFWSALDADSEGEEGRFYVWTAAEVEKALPNADERELAKAFFGVDQRPNFEEKYSILVQPQPVAEFAAKRQWTEKQLAEKLTSVWQKLFEVRAKRARPFLDTKILTAWNGQMFAGLASAGKALNDPKYVAAAKKSAEFILKKLRNTDGRLLRSYLAEPGRPGAAKLNAYLDDYAFLVHGLLTLHEATGEQRWLDEAKTLTDMMIRWHWDEKNGGFFYTSHDHEKLFARSKDQYDGAQPAGNSVAARNLVRLWLVTKEEKYRARAQKQFEAFGTVLKSSPTALTTMVLGLSEFLDARGFENPGGAK